MDKEIFMRDKLSWVKVVTPPDAHYIGMPKRKKEKNPQTTIDEVVNEKEKLEGKLPADSEDESEGQEDNPKAKEKNHRGQITLEETMNGEAAAKRKTKRKRVS